MASLVVFVRCLPGATTTAAAAATVVQQQLMPDGPVDLHGQIAPGARTGHIACALLAIPSLKQCCRCACCTKKHQWQQPPRAHQECSAFMRDLCAETQSNTVARPMLFKAPMRVFSETSLLYQQMGSMLGSCTAARVWESGPCAAC